MDPETKKMLEKTLALEEENNRMLHSMVRAQRIGRIMTYVYWIFIIGSAVGAYYLIQPYVDTFIGAYESASDTIKSFGQ